MRINAVSANRRWVWTFLFSTGGACTSVLINGAGVRRVVVVGAVVLVVEVVVDVGGWTAGADRRGWGTTDVVVCVGVTVGAGGGGGGGGGGGIVVVGGMVGGGCGGFG